MTARNRGAKYISVDPLKTPVQNKADIHIRERPGTDCALAVEVLKVMINEELYDKEFVRQWASSFDKLVGIGGFELQIFCRKAGGAKSPLRQSRIV